MREITAIGVAEEASFAKRAVEHAEKLRLERQQEKAEKHQKKQLSYKEKEKRKRDTGKQSSGIAPPLRCSLLSSDFVSPHRL